MKNLNSNFCPSSRRLHYTAAFLLVLILVIGGAAQNKGESVFAFNAAPPNSEEHAAAGAALNLFLSGLMKKYPCVDQLSDSDLAALIGLEKMKELLGAERDGQSLDERLRDIGGAVGARFVVSFKAASLPNGVTVISAVIVDSKTSRMIANRLEQTGAGRDALQTAESIAQNLLRDTASIFNKKCEAHWTGTIYYSRLKKISKNENSIGYSAGQGVANTSINRSIDENLEETAEILLQPMTLGFSGDVTWARVTQKFRYFNQRITEETATTVCREPGRNPFKKQVSGDEQETRDYSGQTASIETVNVTVWRNTGKYKIEMRNIKEIVTTEKYERNGNLLGCKPIPFSSIRETAGKAGVGYLDLEGEIDPKNPDALTGKKVTGDLENGQETWIWNLRYVNPQNKK